MAIKVLFIIVVVHHQILIFLTRLAQNVSLGEGVEGKGKGEGELAQLWLSYDPKMKFPSLKVWFIYDNSINS